MSGLGSGIKGYGGGVGGNGDEVDGFGDGGGAVEVHDGETAWHFGVCFGWDCRWICWFDLLVWSWCGIYLGEVEEGWG